MATTNLNIRTDKAIKDQAEEIFNELGLNMTTAVNMFLRTAIREHGIQMCIRDRFKRMARRGLSGEILLHEGKENKPWNPAFRTELKSGERAIRPYERDISVSYTHLIRL